MTKDEKRHLSALTELGCAVCRRMGYPGTPAEIHHPRQGVGKAQKASHWDAIPLCPSHHRQGPHAVHTLGTKGFPKHWGFTEADLLEDCRRLLAEVPRLFPTKT